MIQTFPNLTPDARYSPREAYTLLAISYTSLKRFTREGRIEKSYRVDGSPYYTGETINNFWLHRSNPVATLSGPSRLSFHLSSGRGSRAQSRK